MSVGQYFAEVEAVCEILDAFMRRMDPEGDICDDLGTEGYLLNEEVIAAIWQAVELLSRAYAVLYPMAQWESSKAALVLPDVVTAEDNPQPKKARLFDAQGRPLNAE